MLRPAGLFALLVLGTTISGCGEARSLGQVCAADECGSGLTCAFGRCRTECVDDTFCESGRCVEDLGGARGCTLEERDQRCSQRRDCPAPLVCFEDQCRNGCTPACPTGSTCEVRAGTQICEWGDVDGGVVPADGGVDAGRDAGPPDSGAEDDGGTPSGWPSTFPPECIPAPGESIGQSCERNADCTAGFCDVEREVGGISFPDEVEPPVINPGGTCVAFDRSATMPGSRDDSRCGPCATDRGGCLDRCASDGPLPRGGCREGYVCDPQSQVCVAGCQSDGTCQLRLVLTEEGAEWELDPALAGSTCDTATGRCVDEDGDAGVGEACDSHAACGAGLFCAAGDGFEDFDFHVRGVCLEPSSSQPCEGWPGVCTRECTEDAECGDGARCEVVPFQRSIHGSEARRMCLRTCEVGAEAPEDRIGLSGAGAGCPPGMGCYPPGVCAPGEYTAVTEPNVGEACAPAGPYLDSCWSPFGLGRCGVRGHEGATCRVAGCSDPAFGALACPTEVGACVDDTCLRRCDTNAECDGGDICVDAGGVRVCDAACTSNEDCGAGRFCSSFSDGSGTVFARVCTSGFGGPIDEGCFDGAEILLAGSEADEDGWREQRITAAGDATPAPCGGQRLDVVSFAAPARGQFEIEVIGPGQRLVGRVDTGDCTRASAPESYECDIAGPLSQMLEEGQSVSWAVVGTAIADGRRETRLRYRFRRAQSVGAVCGGELGCEVGLSCEALGGERRCVPADLCGGGVPVAGLVSRLRTFPFSEDPQVMADGSGVDHLASSCSAGAAFDYVLRHQAAGRERWILRPSFGALSVRDSCSDAGSERMCSSSFTEPLVIDLDPGEPIDLLHEGSFHNFSATRRFLLAEGQACGAADSECAPGTFCAQEFTSRTCVTEDLGCGAGVEIDGLGLQVAGATPLTTSVRYAPAAPPVADPMDYCERDAADAVAVVSFQVSAPTTIAMITTVQPDNSPAPVWALREACGGATLVCGRRLREELSPVLVPDRTYHLLAFSPAPMEGEIGVRMTLRVPAFTGQPCSEVSRCQPADVCDAGLCRATVCGDGIREAQEQCDDGGVVPGDGCDETCRAEGSCGNGRFELGEQCDDANTVSGDGCSSDCLLGVQEIVSDSCGDAPTFVGVPAGPVNVLRARVERAGATDQVTPSAATCAAPPVPFAPERVLFVAALENEAAQLNVRAGNAIAYNRLAADCATGFFLEACGFSPATANPDDLNGRCVPLPRDALYAVVVEPSADTDVYEFDVVRYPTLPACERRLAGP